MDNLGHSKKAIANATSASGLDFHYKRNLLFFTDTDKRKVYQMQLTKSGTAIHKRDYRYVHELVGELGGLGSPYFPQFV